jgi:cytochrome c biogenesis factor
MTSRFVLFVLWFIVFVSVSMYSNDSIEMVILNLILIVVVYSVDKLLFSNRTQQVKKDIETK